MTALLSSKRNRIIASALVSLLLVVVADAAEFRQWYDDDYTISIVTGHIYPASDLCLFINAALSRFISGVSAALPGVNVFLCFEYAVVFTSLAVLAYEALSRFSSVPVACCLYCAVVIILLPVSTYNDNFTDVSAFGTLAGGMALVIEATEHSPSKPLCVLGAVLFAFGFMLRIESFAMCMLFLVPVFAVRMAFFVRQTQGGDVKPGRFAPIAVALAVCLAAYAYDAVAWSSPEWSEWQEYNHFRSQMSDYPMPPYEAVKGDLDAMGVSDVDYEFALTWRSGDPDYFTVQLMEQLAGLSERAAHPDMGEMVDFAHYTLLYDWRVAFTCLLIVACFVMTFRRMSRIEIAGCVGLFLLALAINIGLFYIGRYLPRVGYPAWACAAVSVALLGTRAAPGQSQRIGESSRERVMQRAAAAFGGATLLFTIFAIVYTVGPTLDNAGQLVGVGRAEELSKSKLVSYIHEHPDTLYLVDVDTAIAYEHGHDMEYLPDKYDQNRIFTMGGWTAHSPMVGARCAEIDVSSPFVGTVERDDMLVITTDRVQAKQFERYLEEHYYDDVLAQHLKTVVVGESHYYVYNFTESSENRREQDDLV